jgi:2-amino-4-hydroxy-6-hydroxymethyldihydropteridine diphosphokinase
MNLSQWMPCYQKILEDFGFSQDDDEKSAQFLNHLLKLRGGLSPGDIPVKEKAIIFGAGPSLKGNVNQLQELDQLQQLKLDEFTIFAADGATTALLEEDLIPDVVVSDLDGEMKNLYQAQRQGAVLVVHAHGDNQEKLKKHVPRLDKVLGTTQSQPVGRVHNWGGFTDGDRAVFLAVELGVRCIILAGMDFGTHTTRYSRPELASEVAEADQIKKLKLQYAKKLVEWVAKHEEVRILNISGGETIKGVKDIHAPRIKEHLSEFH